MVPPAISIFSLTWRRVGRLFDLIALSNDLEERLGVQVDVVTEASLSPYTRDRVLDEAVAL